MRTTVATIVLAAGLLAPRLAGASFHLAVIDELMSGAGSDPSVQYVEIRMLAAGQTVVRNSRLTFFSCEPGNPTRALRLLPSNLASGVADGRWILATPNAAGATCITPDFTFSPGIDPGCGMVCWGAPGATPPSPSTWDATDPNNYVDCVAYGDYTGPAKVGGASTALPAGDGTSSLTRGAGGTFALAPPTPTNNAGQIGRADGRCTTTTTTTTTSTSRTTTTCSRRSTTTTTTCCSSTTSTAPPSTTTTAGAPETTVTTTTETTSTTNAPVPRCASAADCDDADACTQDICYPLAGCVHRSATGLALIECTVDAGREIASEPPAALCRPECSCRIAGALSAVEHLVTAAARADAPRRCRHLLRRAQRRAQHLTRRIAALDAAACFTPSDRGARLLPQVGRLGVRLEALGDAGLCVR